MGRLLPRVREGRARGAVRAAVRGAFLAVLLAAVSAVPGPLDYRYFRLGASVWIVSPGGITVYSLDSRSLRSVVLDENAPRDSIADAAEYDGMLWVSALSGIYQADMATSTVERLPIRPDSISVTRVAVDQDYLWCASRTDTLWQFDKLGREWFAYANPAAAGAGAPVAGLAAGTDLVAVMHGTGASVFSTAEEKWRQYPLAEGRIGPDARMRGGAGLVTLVDGELIGRFSLASLTWERIKASAAITDLIVVDTLTYFLAGSSVSSLTASSPVATRLDVAGLQEPTALAAVGDTLYVAGPRAVARYALSARTTGYLEHASQVAAPSPVAMNGLDSDLVVVHTTALAVYHPADASWDAAELAAGAAGRTRRLTWNDEGLRLRYAPGFSTTLRGSVSKVLRQHDLTLEVDSIEPGRNAIPDETNLTLHTALGPQRYLDVFYDDTRTDQVPAKGVLYSGAPDDILRLAQVGTVAFSSPQGDVLPAAKVEGGAVQVQSAAKLTTRDRHIVRSNAGAGLVLTQTRTAVLSYRQESRNYTLPGTPSGVRDTTMIVPGSVRVIVDGDEVDSSLFRVAYPTRTVQFTRDDIVDPTSVIKVEYQVRTIADSGVTEVEWVPDNSFGQIAFADLTVSPTAWLSPSVGYTYLWDGARHDLASASVPLELRSGASMVKFDPQFAVDVSGDEHTMAGAASLAARLGKRLSLEANGFLADSGFASSDQLTRGYGDRTAEGDFRVSYDVLPEIPLSYYQHNRQSTGGREDRYEISAGVRFPRYPNLDVSVSRNVMDAVFETAAWDSARGQMVSGTDSVDNLKDKVRVRLYETSSPLLQRLTRMHRVGYDLSWTEFRAQTGDIDGWQAGRVVYGRGTIFPINPVAVSLTGTYRQNPAGLRYSRTIEPSVTVQTTDWPKGVDLDAHYNLDFGRLSAADSSTATLDRGGDVTLKLGAWWQGLRWFTLRGGVVESRTCHFATTDPSFSAIVLGNQSVSASQWKPMAGLTVFPSSVALFVSTNDWTLSDSLADFRTVNDLKLWLGKRAVWQTRWQTETHGDKPDMHQGLSHYDKTWNSWLKTGQGVFANYQRGDTLRVVQAGPEVSAEVNVKEFLRVFRSLRMSHAVRLQWERIDGEYQWNPDLSYTFYVRAVAKPNIVYEMSGSLMTDRGVFQAYEAEMWLRLLF